MNFDLTTGIMIGAAILLGVTYFLRRVSRLKRQQRKL